MSDDDTPAPAPAPAPARATAAPPPTFATAAKPSPAPSLNDLVLPASSSSDDVDVDVASLQNIPPEDLLGWRDNADVYDEDDDSDQDEAFQDAMEVIEKQLEEEGNSAVGGGGQQQQQEQPRRSDLLDDFRTEAERQDEAESDEEERERQRWSDLEQKKDQLEQRKKREEAMTEEERESLRDSAQTLKKEGNEFYLSGDQVSAVQRYSDALEQCPLVYKEDRAVLFANRAAAKIKQGLPEAAVTDCSEAISLKPDYVKALLRRASLYEDEQDKPHEAMKDFEAVLEIDPKSQAANAAVRRLPELIRKKDEQIKEEMMGNLKKLGNMVLNPFGLSTENFQFVQDPKTGGYSVNFNNKQ